MNKSNAITDLLNSISKEEAERIENKMLLAAKIDEARIAKGWKKNELMKAMGKDNPSEVTKWLSGTHNFTTDTLIDLQRILGIKLFNIETKIEDTIVYELRINVSQEAHGIAYASPTRKRIKNPMGTYSYSGNLIQQTAEA